MTPRLPGPRHLGDSRTRFAVWAPLAERVDVHVTTPFDKVVPMEPADRGYHVATVEDTEPGARYLYKIGDRELPDPASRSQPEGVHGPSEVFDPDAFDWSDDTWFGHPLHDYVIYELHVGTYTPEGTFDAIVPHLDELADLGVTAIELMPIAEFPGGRNWGYDGVFPYAAQSTYGGPEGLQRLVDACHRREIAVVLDVVYNHLGPEGSVHSDFGPYFTDRYRTPWGDALNLDGEGSDEVRRHFIGNALWWFEACHVDALRLDAVHAILDTSALPFLEELAIETAELSDELNRRLHLIAESSDNDARIITSRELGGFGLDAQWNDDFHHALYAYVTGDRVGPYEDYGDLGHLATAYQDGYVYQGEYSAFRGRRHGRSSKRSDARRFVVFTRNHDQIGNRMDGARLADRVPSEDLRLVVGAVLLSPYIPLLFMGEEYGEKAPFLYFVSHTHEELLRAVREGRKRDFESFGWEGEPPDPGAEETFLRSKLDHGLKTQEGPHTALRRYYAELLRLRREVPALAQVDKDSLRVTDDERHGTLILHRWTDETEAVCLFNFSDDDRDVPFPHPRERWELLFSSADERWGGSGHAAPATFHGSNEATVAVPRRAFLVYRTRGRD